MIKMLKEGITVILVLGICGSLSGQTTSEKQDTISFLFAGDIMGHDEQIWSAENRENHTYNYDDVFRYITPIISEADIAIGNFEVTLGGAPYTGYPQFSSPAALASAVKKSGFDYLVTANNHSADRGRKGITSTIFRLDSLGIPHTGTFESKNARDSLYPLMFSCKGTSIALLNYTYGTNGIKVPEPVIVNLLDKDIITSDVMKAKEKNAEIIILFLHWGTEYDTIPSKTQVDLANYFFSIGVDLVIGSHPHVLQKMVLTRSESGTRDGIAVYSMGNFVSNQRKPKTDGGAIVRIEMIRENNKFRIGEAGYYLTWVYTPIEMYRKKFFILPCSEYENNKTFFAAPQDYYKMKSFIKNSRDLLYKQNVGVPEYLYH